MHPIPPEPPPGRTKPHHGENNGRLLLLLKGGQSTTRSIFWDANVFLEKQKINGVSSTDVHTSCPRGDNKLRAIC